MHDWSLYGPKMFCPRVQIPGSIVMSFGVLVDFWGVPYVGVLFILLKIVGPVIIYALLDELGECLELVHKLVDDIPNPLHRQLQRKFSSGYQYMSRYTIKIVFIKKKDGYPGRRKNKVT